MVCVGTYDGKIFYNESNKFCVVNIKTTDKNIPMEARSTRRYKDHLIRFVAVGYEIPFTDSIELELDGEWEKGKYGMQLNVKSFKEIVPMTTDGLQGYLSSGLIKGIGEKTAADIISKFGLSTLDILDKNPDRLLEVRGITESKLVDIINSYNESKRLRELMSLLAPFKISAKTAISIYEHFGISCVDILKKILLSFARFRVLGFIGWMELSERRMED